MLPHILHSTGRAVAVVHNQTHTIRNVLQLQSSGPSSGSGSSWGNGPGPGSAKYGAGNRFYAGHSSAGRAVTQANAVTSHDGQISQTDDIEESPVKWTILSTPQRKRRIRSSSLSMGVAGRTERGEKLGVLKTVQLHARGRHAFAPNDSMDLAKEKLLADPLPVAQPTQALLVRRNSTSAPLSPLLNPTEPPPPPPKSPKPTHEQVDTAQTEAKEDGAGEKQSSTRSKVEEEVEHFLSIAKSRDFAGCARSVRRMLLSYDVPPVEMFNAALYATLQTRPAGAPIKPVLDLYNLMLSKSITPTVETYETLIHALTTRDFEVHRAKLALDLRIKKESDDKLPSDNIEKARMQALYKEDNFASAMSLFEGVLAVNGKDQLMMSTFVRLINCAANHADVNSAIHVYAQLETRKDITIPVQVYRYLIHAFSNAGQINEAEEIFNTFISAGAKNKLFQYTGKLVALGRQGQIQVWNSMIEAYFRAGLPDKAIELVDQVLKSDAGNNFTTADAPVATSSMFTTVINGFLTTGDTESALTWFEKLLAQEPAPADPYQGLSGRVMRPDGQAWLLMMDYLADRGDVDDLNRLFRILKQQHKGSDEPVNNTIRLIVYTANMEHLQKKSLESPVVIENLKYLVQDMHEYNGRDKEQLLLDMCLELVSLGEFSVPCASFIHFVNSGFDHWSAAWSATSIQATSAFMQSISNAVHSGVGILGFSEALPLARLVHKLGMRPDIRFAPIFLHAYGRMINGDDVEWNLSVDDWQLLLSYAMQYDLNMVAGNPANLQVFPGFVPQDILSLFKRFHALGLSFSALSEDVRLHILGVIQSQNPDESLRTILLQYGPEYLETLDKYDEHVFTSVQRNVMQTADEFNPVASQLLPTERPAVRVDPYLGKRIAQTIGQAIGDALPPSVEKAYSLYEQGVRANKTPGIDVLCRLIESSGRVKDLDKVRELYTTAQAVLHITPAESQRYEWAAIENSMIIALAHAGHVDAAHVHRLRILDQGLCPSADAYGILVQLVKDTTDDTSGAVVLFEEALARGVRPNLYLYNNIISKLSRARKADYALELFEQMKAGGLTPSSITYGAVIGACARVGDVPAAENLFKEMVRNPQFRPRVPPYNTMMQLYTQTKPNRTSALYFYNEMKKAFVKPSAHTYKLLLDTHGSLEPVALDSMEEVFAELLANESVQVTGTHFASLINAYGCVSKDLNKAISVFESMGTFPRSPKPDAVAFEAIINAIVANKRTDLLPVYVGKMTELGVHMTAYIANFLIKGYASVGDMAKAREIFESLANPPMGVAAPNNHAPHSPELSHEVPVMSPVYREPSTWEAMVRAELGAGNRDAALTLLERLYERRYPEAVYNRISGILTDFSVLQ